MELCLGLGLVGHACSPIIGKAETKGIQVKVDLDDKGRLKKGRRRKKEKKEK